jgi:hypothetical protein
MKSERLIICLQGLSGFYNSDNIALLLILQYHSISIRQIVNFEFILSTILLLQFDQMFKLLL